MDKEVNVEKLAKEIELALNIKLMATKEDDIVHGYIHYDDGIKRVYVHLYETDENPTLKRKSTLSKHNLNPTQIQTLQSVIQSHVRGIQP